MCSTCPLLHFPPPPRLDRADLSTPANSINPRVLPDKPLVLAALARNRRSTRPVCYVRPWMDRRHLTTRNGCHLGFVELCATILQIMRNDFKDYARTFCQLFLPLFAKNLFRFYITHSRIQDRPILCLWDRQNSLPPSSKTLDFLYCLARSAALTLAES